MDPVAQRVIELAGELARKSHEVQTRAEFAASREMARMMVDPAGKAFTLAMPDRVFRSHRPARQASQLRRLLERFGVPGFLSTGRRVLLGTGAAVSRVIPGIVMPAIRNELQRSSSRVILDAAPEKLDAYLRKRRSAGTRVNLNHLGEAILGEEEAQRRLAAILSHLDNPLVDYVSVKISAIFSQINVIDWDGTLRVIKERLRTLYRAAKERNKFVNLDMEEYRDLELTLAAFQEVLDETEFLSFSAGIVLQAYLPDSWSAQQRLIEWSKRRIARGGVPIKMRLVKGANMSMERVEAELHGWNAAPYQQKVQTDANYRRMMEYGCQPENAAAVRLGVATHNLFDVALALVLRDLNGVHDRVELEMLEGMANQQARAVQETAGGLLVYAPAVRKEDFISALAYLVRRLEENTSPQNFLHDLFSLQPGSEAWQRQEKQFLDGWELRQEVCGCSRRARPAPTPEDGSFYNAPDTDWTQRASREALSKAMHAWRVTEIPPLAELQTVLQTAVAAQQSWEAAGAAARATILRRAGDVMQSARFDTIVQMMYEAKKTAGEADIEVSEAIDFARYNAKTAAPLPQVKANALGVVVVTPPWNFPYAIPCGNVTGALAAGNAVILKPAPQTVGVAWRLANHLWEAGVPRDVLQFFPCPDGDIGRALISDPRVTAVVLTGSYETARMFQSWRPSLRLFAETSGKNAIVVTGQADRDLAIKDIVTSAFGHAGQKCSAASLAILEAEVYDDPAFLRALRDAAASLRVGQATDLGTFVPPIIGEPSANLRRALTTLDPGETWLLEPKVDASDPCLWSPGIKLGVKPGSWFHQTECFGPVLGLMRADNLDHAIELQNGTPYGLTAGLHSLDESEIAKWMGTVQAGNAYVNRQITGAIVRRQPFGGWKKSSIGPGTKAGGPNYTMLFADIRDREDAPPDYPEWMGKYFSLEHDPSNLASQSNHFRYRRARGVVLRLDRADESAASRAIEVARVCNVPLTISFIDQESDEQLIQRLPGLSAEILRTVKTPGDRLLQAAYDAGINWINAPVLRCGRYELTRWLREQSVSITQHRYGLIASLAK
jgi:RHH-type proline utilization regulon transcriptional repressor/proline dehydrogenase/delta 1-pyrroline-5-carboxylate dehydrogenase